jgi:4-amino-4-deoxy-L-arabinose transferase-like glycosyltransferase
MLLPKVNLKLFLILLFSLFLYTYQLATIPSSVYVDEATVGLNAYSLLTTGKDEFGQITPLYFRFFGSYTPGLFVYFIIPFIKLFGLSALIVRLPTALCGVFSVYLFYKTLSIFTKKKYWGTFFYAIIPWTVFNSRLGYEVLFAATIFNLGIYFLLKNIPRLSLWGLFFISLSTYAAHTQRYFAPLFLLVYFLIFKNITKKSILLLLSTQIPNIIILFSPIFWVKNAEFTLTRFLNQFITYLSPQTIFFNLPDIDQQHLIPLISILFWWMIIPFIVGIKNSARLPKTHQQFLFFWFFISLIPASLSGEFISIQRALPFLFPLMIVVSLGISQSNILNSILSFYSLILLYRSYFVFFPKEKALGWNYGYQELSQFINDNENKTFLIDNSRNPRNYILPLFYLKIIPKDTLNNYYQAPPLPSTITYDHLTFTNLNWSQVKNYNYIVSDGLSVSPSQAVEHSLVKEKTILTPNNDVALEIYKVK